jgi:hypothetical protein
MTRMLRMKTDFDVVICLIRVIRIVLFVAKKRFLFVKAKTENDLPEQETGLRE